MIYIIIAALVSLCAFLFILIDGRRRRPALPRKKRSPFSRSYLRKRFSPFLRLIDERVNHSRPRAQCADTLAEKRYWQDRKALLLSCRRNLVQARRRGDLSALPMEASNV